MAKPMSHRVREKHVALDRDLIVRMKLIGKLEQQIADELGYKLNHVTRLIKAELKRASERRNDNADALLALEVNRLDWLQTQLVAGMDHKEQVTRIKTSAEIRAIINLRCELLALKTSVAPPVSQNITFNIGQPGMKINTKPVSSREVKLIEGEANGND